jgi:hypothetical protein
MNRFVPCEERTRASFLPSRPEDYVTGDNPVRAIDVFVGELDLTKLGFEEMNPQATGGSGYHASTLLQKRLSRMRRAVNTQGFCSWR